MKNKNMESLKKWAVFSTLVFQMAAIIGLAVFAGVKLDEKTSASTPVFTIVLSLSGVFLALYVVFRQLQKINKNNSQ